MRRSSSMSGRPSIGAPARVMKPTNEPQQPPARRSASMDRTSLASASKFGFVADNSSVKRPGAPMSALPQSKQRRASMRGFSASEQAKDPRPITDKAYRERCVRDLVEFLTTHGYAHQISFKQLVSPSAADFRKIFEFLMGFIMPNYKLQSKKLDEEVPNVFRLIGYPFIIPKSYMSTVGAQHTWPTILGALTWLRVLIQTSTTYDVEAMMFPAADGQEFDRVPEKKILHEYVRESYMSFMAGKDTYDEERAKMEKALVGDSHIDDEIGELERELARSDLVLAALENQPNELPDLQDQLTLLTVDTNKMKHYCTNLEQHQKEQLGRIASLEDEDRALKVKCAELGAELARREEVLVRQNQSGVDVQDLSAERSTSRRRLAQIEAELCEVDSAIQAAERVVRDEREQVETLIASYRKIHQALQLFPIYAESAEGEDLEMSPGLGKEEQDHYRLVVRPALFRIQQRIGDHCHGLEEAVAGESAAVDQLDEMIGDLVARIDKVTGSISEADEQLVNMKETHASTMAALEAEKASQRAILQNIVAGGATGGFGGASGGPGGACRFASIAEAEQEFARVKESLEAKRARKQEELDRMEDEVDILIAETLQMKKDAEEKMKRDSIAIRQGYQEVVEALRAKEAAEIEAFESFMKS